VVWIFDKPDRGRLSGDGDEKLDGQRGRARQVSGQMDEILLHVPRLESETYHGQRHDNRLRHGYDQPEHTAHPDDPEFSPKIIAVFGK